MPPRPERTLTRPAPAYDGGPSVLLVQAYSWGQMITETRHRVVTSQGIYELLPPVTLPDPVLIQPADGLFAQDSIADMARDSWAALADVLALPAPGTTLYGGLTPDDLGLILDARDVRHGASRRIVIVKLSSTEADQDTRRGCGRAASGSPGCSSPSPAR